VGKLKSNDECATLRLKLCGENRANVLRSKQILSEKKGEYYSIEKTINHILDEYFKG
jgi:hypothetical protein